MLKTENIILYLIVFLALALRLYGINYDVPHPDDYTTVQGAMFFADLIVCVEISNTSYLIIAERRPYDDFFHFISFICSKAIISSWKLPLLAAISFLSRV